MNMGEGVCTTSKGWERYGGGKGSSGTHNSANRRERRSETHIPTVRDDLSHALHTHTHTHRCVRPCAATVKSYNEREDTPQKRRSKSALWPTTVSRHFPVATTANRTLSPNRHSNATHWHAPAHLCFPSPWHPLPCTWAVSLSL